MIIGVTGGIASGKSEVCRILSNNGFIHIDADDVAHHVLEDCRIIEKVMSVFGDGVTSRNADGSIYIDRKKLGKIVFSDDSKMDLLENITHPQIVETIAGMIKENNDRNYVIEAIELVSSGLAGICNELWVVHAEPEQQLRRLMEYRHMSYEDAVSRLKSQEVHDWDETSADRIIYSTEPLESMELQVLDAINNSLID